jgi:hypothetical protein
LRALLCSAFRLPFIFTGCKAMNYHTETLTVGGTDYRVNYMYDADCSPWDDDGRGIVTEWESRDKHPGELILNSDGRHKRFYDFAGSMAKARRDGWGISGDVTGLSKGEILQRAVMADYEYLRAYCRDEWHYVCLQVFPLTVDGDELKSKSVYLGGIESTDDDYLKESALELISEIEATQ